MSGFMVKINTDFSSCLARSSLFEESCDHQTSRFSSLRFPGTAVVKMLLVFITAVSLLPNFQGKSTKVDSCVLSQDLKHAIFLFHMLF